ncbi:hypothetical protein ONZ45_g19270 [Pleurotus djamor]|nr:hypothetical protein ONZ45_g19270 [Pleurotus djamor]
MMAGLLVGVAAALSGQTPRRSVFNQFSLEKKVALVTGGQRGIGLEVALAFAEAGAVVYCLDLPQDPDNDFKLAQNFASALPVSAPGVENGRLEYVSGDVTDQLQMWKIAEDIVAKEGRLDICFANAGILAGAECLEYPADAFTKVRSFMKTLLNYSELTYVPLSVAYVHQRKRRSTYRASSWTSNGKLGIPGSIIMTASICGTTTIKDQHWLAYQTSKSAVLQMARSMACELGAKGIRVNTLSPGFIETKCTPLFLFKGSCLLIMGLYRMTDSDALMSYEERVCGLQVMPPLSALEAKEVQRLPSDVETLTSQSPCSSPLLKSSSHGDQFITSLYTAFPTGEANVFYRENELKDPIPLSPHNTTKHVFPASTTHKIQSLMARIYPDLNDQCAIDKKIAKHMKIVCALRTRRNTLAAISKLPNEIIAEIFIACRTLREIFNHTPSAIILVCTAWRDIALSTPQVWSHISFEDPNSISRSLVHSKKEPLTVECDAYHFYGFEQRHPMRLLARETYRFEELRISGPGDDTSRMAAHFFQKDRSPSAPLLQKLSIQVDVGGGGDEDSMTPRIMTSFWKDLTALRSMTFRKILPTSAPYLPSLRHLTIDVSSKGRFLSIPWVIQLLRNAPLLENATVGKISSDHPISLTPPLPIAIPLLGLRTIKLKLKFLQESKLLSYLQIPDTANVDIEFQGCGDTRKIQENISHLRRFISTRFPPDSSLDVRVVMAAFTDDDYTLTVGTN